MKTLAKTRIVRVRGAEIYFAKVMLEGETRWREFRKDVSALCRSHQDTRFTGSDSVQREPKLWDELVAPLPPGFSEDLLGPYAANEYAPGHAPSPRLQLR